MPPEARVEAWGAIDGKLEGRPAGTRSVIVSQANPRGSSAPATLYPPNPETASTPVPPAMPADPGYQAGPYKGALTPPPAQAMNKHYPLCSATIQDECVNPREAGSN